MSISLWTFACALGLLAGPAFAQGDGRNEASAECGRSRFDSDRTACLNVVSGADYFDLAAVAVCASVEFGSDKTACMAAIADKTFLPAEIKNCGSSPFGSNRTDCFKGAGRVRVPDSPYDSPRGNDRYILRSLRRIQDQLYSGDVGDARAGVEKLVQFVEKDMRR